MRLIGSHAPGIFFLSGSYLRFLFALRERHIVLSRNLKTSLRLFVCVDFEVGLCLGYFYVRFVDGKHFFRYFIVKWDAI